MSEDPAKKFKRIGIVGAGNMGTMMSFGFAEQGVDVSLWDIKPENVDQALDMVKKQDNIKDKVHGFHDIHEFTKSLDDAPRKVFLFSITHGWPADSVLEKIRDDLKEGDIIVDGGNEHYRNTERRQKELEKKGVKWIGTGVSGGYQVRSNRVFSVAQADTAGPVGKTRPQHVSRRRQTSRRRSTASPSKVRR